MQIVRDLAGYSMGRSDLVRRAMSKKKHSVMEQERKNFIYGLEDESGNIIVPGAIRNGVSEAHASKIFDQMMDFASYAFNKSHAAAYAVVGYQTAFLKRHYPVEFMTAMLTSIMGNNDKVAFYIHACKKMNIEVLPPDVNESFVDFAVSNNKIRFGLAAIKNVGKGAIQSIIEARQKKPFSGFTDFCERVNLSEVSKRAVESMIKAGAFDSLKLGRAQLLGVFERVIDAVMNSKRRNIEGQVSMFSLGTQGNEDSSRDDFEEIKEFSPRYQLAMEKEMLGLYISGHPLDEFSEELDIQTNIRISEIITVQTEEVEVIDVKVQDGQRVVVGGIVSSITIKSTRNNEIMEFITIEDVGGSIEALVFPKVYQKYGKLIIEDNVVLIKGRISIREGEQPKLIAEEIKELSRGSNKHYDRLFVRLPEASVPELKQMLAKSPGPTPVFLVIEETMKKMGAPRDLWVTINDELITDLNMRFGESNIKLT